MTVAKKSVLITGCSDGGLGAALAEAFHNAGLEVYATARNPAKMTHVRSLGIKTLTLDVMSDSSIAECVAQVPHLDILVNNAGANYAMPIVDTDIAEAKKLFDLNVWSYLAVSQAFLPLLVKSKGVLANNTSVASVISVPWAGIYGASKAAMAAISNTMRLEMEPFGVKVVDLKTGVVTSNFFQNAEQRSAVSLPKSSIYKPFADIIEKNMKGEEIQGTGMDSKVWAKKVVAELLGSSVKAQIWKGANASLVRLVALLPFSIADGPMKQRGGINEIASRKRSGA